MLKSFISKIKGKKFIEACKKEDIKTIKSYIDKGFDINYSNKHGDCGFECILDNNGYKHYNHDLIEYFLRNNVNVKKRGYDLQTILLIVCRNNDIEMVKLALSLNAEINALHTAMWTPLMEACEKKHFDIVKVLVEAGADVNIRDDEEDTAIDHAYGNEEIISYLRAHGGKSGKELKTNL